MSDCGMKNAANALLEDLTTDVNIKLPIVDLTSPLFNFPGGTDSLLYKAIVPLTNDDLTTRSVNGTGTFDALMAGVDAHLAHQWDKGRITGDEYSKVYVAMTEVAMANSVQFLVNRDATFWAAQTAQLQAITARIMLETEKARLATAQIDALNATSNYALSKAALAKASIDHCIQKFQLDNILPKENTALLKQIEGYDLDNRTKNYNLEAILKTQHSGMQLENDTKAYNLDTTLPLQTSILGKQDEGLGIENQTKTYTLAEILPLEKTALSTQISGYLIDNQTKTYNLSSILAAQHAGLLVDNQIKTYNLSTMLPIDTDIKTFNLSQLMPAQLKLIKEQYEVQLAQTSDKRSDNSNVVGTLGKQKDLYTQQIESYKRNSEHQAAKVFTDAWTVMKTIDEGLTPPAGFANSNIDTVLTKIRTANSL